MPDSDEILAQVFQLKVVEDCGDPYSKFNYQRAREIRNSVAIGPEALTDVTYLSILAAGILMAVALLTATLDSNWT